VLIPFLAKKIEQNKESARSFLNNVFSAFFLTITIASFLVFLAMPWLARMFFPGFSGAMLQDKLIPLTRIMLLSPILLGLSSLFASVTQIYRKFFLYALSPLLYNIGIIGGVVFFYPIFGVIGLGYGVVAGALMHLIIQVPAVRQNGFLPRFRPRLDLPELRRVVMLSLPRTLALSAHQVALLALVGLASMQSEGSISVFNLSFNLQSVPLSIIGVSYSVAAFPTLARFFAKGEKDKFFNSVVTAVRHIIFWSLPALVLFIVLRAQIVRVIYGSGEFDWSATRLTAASLAMFAFSIVAQSLVLLFVRGYYAAGKTKKPVIINLLSSFLIMAGAYALVELFQGHGLFRYFITSLFRIDDVAGSAIIMLPFAYSLGLLINASVLWVVFQRDFRAFSSRVRQTLFQTFCASVIMGFSSFLLLNVLDNVFDLNTFMGIFSQGLLAGTGGIISGIFILCLLKNKEIEEIWRAVHTKFWKTKTIAAEQEEL
jgi:putative peptidoglycan lipid II flippase